MDSAIKSFQREESDEKPSGHFDQKFEQPISAADDSSEAYVSSYQSETDLRETQFDFKTFPETIDDQSSLGLKFEYSFYYYIIMYIIRRS